MTGGMVQEPRSFRGGFLLLIPRDDRAITCSEMHQPLDTCCERDRGILRLISPTEGGAGSDRTGGRAFQSTMLDDKTVRTMPFRCRLGRTSLAKPC